MTSEFPNLPKTGRYSITEAALALKMSRNKLREVPLERLPVHYRLNGRKFYFGEDLNAFWRRDWNRRHPIEKLNRHR